VAVLPLAKSSMGKEKAKLQGKWRITELIIYLIKKNY